jgi:WD40 repeat protein
MQRRRIPCALAIGFVAVSVIGRGEALSPGERKELVLQTPPAAAVNSVAVSPDGSVVATAAAEGGVRLYDAKTGTLLRALGEVGDRSVVFAPDGRTFAAAGFHMDKRIGIFDVETGRRLRTLGGLAEWEVDACAIAPDGRRLAASGVDRRILVWDLESGELVLKIADLAARVPALAFSPDGATIAGGSDGLVRLWDAATGEARRTLEGQRGWVCTLAYSRDGKTLASGSCDWGYHRGHGWPLPQGRGPERCEWRVWDVATGEAKRVVQDTGRLLSLTIAPDGGSLACGLGREVRLYELSSAGAGYVLTTHDDGVTSVAFTADGRAVISGSHDQTVQRTSAGTGKPDWRAPGWYEQVNAVALSLDGSLLATGSSDGRVALGARQPGEQRTGPGAVRLWDARTGRMLRQLGGGTEQIMAVSISPDGGRVAAAGGGADGEGVVAVWETSGSKVWSVGDHGEEVLAVAFAPDGSAVASGDAAGVIKVRDSRTGALMTLLEGHPGGATSLEFTADGKALVCGGGHGVAVLWEVGSGTRLRTFGSTSTQAASARWDQPMTSVALSRDGTTLATCTSAVNQTFAEPVRIWDVASGRLVREFADPMVSGRPMALSPDGSVIATGGKTVRLWDARTGKLLRELLGRLKRTQSIVFSADGRRVVSGGSYGTTNVWEAATGRHLVTLIGLPDAEGRGVDDWLAYHPDGFYAGSPGVERWLAWRVGDEFVTGARLEPELNRPERIADTLGRSLP